MIGLIPAYGRDYKNKAEVLTAYNAGKDFIITDITNRWNGMAANNADLKVEGKVKIRYGLLARVIVVDAVTGKEVK
jgi:hypothetical protein